ncbi:transcriptional regulator [Oceanobacillus kimchii]|uniref:Transcriptional regulator n=2 Tax=Bacillaceae TaxID=186817 RepID=A0ABQ5TRV3_9BACI|nr:transcriptional regulator [Oceanobacillus kimchii]
MPLDAPITIFTIALHLSNNEKGKAMNNMIFGDKLKKEREKRGWSQDYLAEKVYVSRQSVSKWETGKNYPSIEVIINLSDLFGITIDELLRSDEELKEKVIRDSKQLAHPKWKTFFDSLFLLGAFLLLVKLIILGLNYFIGTEFLVTDGKLVKILANFLPLAMMIIGGIGSDSLKDKYID